jgi:arylsulfatase A-like enzyme
MWGEHGLILKKQVPYQESVRVPFAMRWPAKQPGGRIDRRIAANIDIAPTVYEAVGLKRSDIGFEMDGRSLLSRKRRERILIESLISDKKAPLWRGLWTPDWQYIRYSTGEREYYNTVRDPFQVKNLLRNESKTDDPSKDRIRRLERSLRAAANCRASACP